jgi:hypothetical protein
MLGLAFASAIVAIGASRMQGLPATTAPLLQQQPSYQLKSHGRIVEVPRSTFLVVGVAELITLMCGETSVALVLSVLPIRPLGG